MTNKQLCVLQPFNSTSILTRLLKQAEELLQKAMSGHFDVEVDQPVAGAMRKQAQVPEAEKSCQPAGVAEQTTALPDAAGQAKEAAAEPTMYRCVRTCMRCSIVEVRYTFVFAPT